LISGPGQHVERIILKLYDNIVPRIAENFRQLAIGQNGFGHKGGKSTVISPNQYFYVVLSTSGRQFIDGESIPGIINSPIVFRSH
jgi:cyclophilin family peptidyl-prolyl cis-trans isomerase